MNGNVLYCKGQAWEAEHCWERASMYISGYRQHSFTIWDKSAKPAFLITGYGAQRLELKE